MEKILFPDTSFCNAFFSPIAKNVRTANTADLGTSTLTLD